MKRNNMGRTRIHGSKPTESWHTEGLSERDFSLLKKGLFTLAVVLGFSIPVHLIMTFPKSFSSISNLNFEVHSINLANGVHVAPAVKIDNRKDIDNILNLLNSHQYRREYHYPLVPKGGGGSLYNLGLNDISSNQRILININGKRLTIKGKDYIADQNVGWKIAGYLMMKNLDQKTDLSLVKTAHENLDRLSKKYGEPKPFITEIKPGVTNINSRTRPMYDVHLKGNFTKGNLHADNLYFSMLESGSTVWAIRATGSNNKLVWGEN